MRRIETANTTRAWRQWHVDQLVEALAGLHRDVIGRLMAHLRNLRSARELITFIGAQDWSAVDAGTRLVVLHEINAAIIRLRESQKLEPISDPLPGAPPNALQVIRGILQVSRKGKPTGASGKQ